jgi:hypothetical protein
VVRQRLDRPAGGLRAPGAHLDHHRRVRPPRPLLDAATGERILPDFVTGDLVKGSLAVDPNGYPPVYTGSRDNYYRVIAFDRDKPTELWRLDADSIRPKMWNNDWDGAALVIDDYLFEGGENSNIHIIKLNRGYGADGKVTSIRSLSSTLRAGMPSC